MSRITKTILAGLLASAVAAPVAAQSTASPFAKLLSGNAADTATDDLRDQIRARILELATTPDASSSPAPSAATIGDIDKLNRSAEQAKAELELERMRGEKRRMELEQMITLYETLRSLEEKEPAPQVQQAAPVSNDASNGQDPLPQAAQDKPDATAIDTPRLPRIDMISGAAGNFEVYVINPDATVRVMREGDYLHTGFELVEITPRHASFKSETTGKTYRLVPQSAPAEDSETSTSGPGVGIPRNAIDLSGLPLNGF